MHKIICYNPDCQWLWRVVGGSITFQDANTCALRDTKDFAKKGKELKTIVTDWLQSSNRFKRIIQSIIKWGS